MAALPFPIPGLPDLTKLAGAVAPFFGGNSARSASSSSSSVNVAVNPSIANVQGSGYASPSSGGYASGSASASADASGDNLPGYLPTTGGYGLGSTKAYPATYDSLDIARTQPGMFGGIGDDQMLLLLAAAGVALFLFLSPGKG